jgi:hypothetical protein
VFQLYRKIVPDWEDNYFSLMILKIKDEKNSKPICLIQPNSLLG